MSKNKSNTKSNPRVRESSKIENYKYKSNKASKFQRVNRSSPTGKSKTLNSILIKKGICQSQKA